MIGMWDWFQDKAESWGPTELALVIMAIGVTSFLLMCGLAILIWSM